MSLKFYVHLFSNYELSTIWHPRNKNLIHRHLCKIGKELGPTILRGLSRGMQGLPVLYTELFALLSFDHTLWEQSRYEFDNMTFE